MITGGCGFHYYYRRPEGLDLSLPIIAENIVRSGGVPPLGVGVDIPSYLVAPPSRHFTGGVYQWKVDGDPYQVPLGDAPGWMVERLTKTATKEIEISGGKRLSYRRKPYLDLEAIAVWDVVSER